MRRSTRQQVPKIVRSSPMIRRSSTRRPTALAAARLALAHAPSDVARAAAQAIITAVEPYAQADLSGG